MIRHPQYVGLAVCGAGMSILWPRFLTLVTLWIMMVLYYFLARDEERRMTERFGDSYREYMARTGMFLPRAIEEPLASAAAKLVRGREDGRRRRWPSGRCCSGWASG